MFSSLSKMFTIENVGYPRGAVKYIVGCHLDATGQYIYYNLVHENGAHTLEEVENCPLVCEALEAPWIAVVEHLKKVQRAYQRKSAVYSRPGPEENDSYLVDAILGKFFKQFL